LVENNKNVINPWALARTKTNNKLVPSRPWNRCATMNTDAQWRVEHTLFPRGFLYYAARRTTDHNTEWVTTT